MPYNIVKASLSNKIYVFDYDYYIRVYDHNEYITKISYFSDLYTNCEHENELEEEYSFYYKVDIKF